MKVVIFAQLGSPKSPRRRDVREYLKAFLSNRLVVDLNPILWKLILHIFILPFRSKKSAARYQQIWDGEKFLLNTNSEGFVNKLKHYGVICDLGYVLGKPSLKEILRKYKDEEVIVWPLFPQYCKSTTGLIEEIIGDQDVKLISSFHDHDYYIDSCVKKIEEALIQKSVDTLILSFHSVPIENNGVYIQHCLQSFQLIKSKISHQNVLLAFQSKFGRGQWMGPSLEVLIEQEAKEGRTQTAVFCPGFLMDCLETQLEVGTELKERVRPWGVDLSYIDCLNDWDYWCESFFKELE